MTLTRSLLFLMLLYGIRALCPSNCTCYLDHKGRNTVYCKSGGLIGPLALNMSLDVEVLKISAPEDNMNMLTMSPIFYNYRNLEEIYITRSNIPQLGMHFFWGLTKLDVLDLSQNNITQPLDHNFRGLFKLKELYLDDNRIYSLPSGTFRYLQELKLLSIQRNRISELMPRIFLEIRKLRVLKLSGNNLKELNPVVFEDIQDLRSLECRGCFLQNLSKDVFKLLPHLINLDLGDNHINHISSDNLSSLKRLKTLRLDGNYLKSIKESIFINQNELKKLNLARNNIDTVSRDAFENLHNLTELDLSYNKLDMLEKGVLEPVAGTLEIVILSGNRVDVQLLKGWLNNLEIRQLYLGEAGLVEISEQVFPESLLILNLADNYLSSLPGEVIPINLIDIDLSGNRFRGLEEELLMKLDNLKSMKLDRNPWSCDLCHIVPLLERVNRSTIIKDIKCQHPFTAEGKKLGMLSRNELTWCTVPSYTSGDANYFLLGNEGKIGIIAAGTSVCLLLLTAIAILGALFYSKRHAARYYTHEDKLASDSDLIFDTHSPLFCEDRELSFKFSLDNSERKLSVATIDGIKKEHAIINGT